MARLLLRTLSTMTCNGTPIEKASVDMDASDNVVLLSRRPPSLLIADGVKQICDSLVLLLRCEGYEAHSIVSACDGSNVRELLRTSSYDIVLASVGTGGLQLLDEIKRRRLPTVVILITAYNAEDIAPLAESRGALCCLQKPFDVTKLLEALARAERLCEQHLLDTTSRSPKAVPLSEAV
jgi:two-component system, response regulator, stage 0 sporulation protein F